jgi:hypothetical protein
MLDVPGDWRIESHQAHLKVTVSSVGSSAKPYGKSPEVTPTFSTLELRLLKKCRKTVDISHTDHNSSDKFSSFRHSICSTRASSSVQCSMYILDERAEHISSRQQYLKPLDYIYEGYA